MQKINFCHLMPTAYLPHLGTKCRAELVLAHIAKEDSTYSQWFYDNPTRMNFRGHYIYAKRIMDNGAFELGESMNPEELIDLGKAVKATHLVLPDYPGEEPEKTIEAAKKWGPEFKKAGFQTIFVPQGRVGSIEDFDKALLWAGHNMEWPATADNKHNMIGAVAASLNADKIVNEIAMSIIGVPNIYGTYRNKTQRHLARWYYLSTLPRRAWHLYSMIRNVPLHMLGLLDGVNEIPLIQQLQRNEHHNGYNHYGYNIDSWDSSAAVWYAHNEVMIDDGTPTGRRDGKFELEVDFGAPANQITLAAAHMNHIDKLCGHNY